MGYVAVKRLRWGDADIEPGDPVPEDEPGRDYHGMEQRGEIALLRGVPASDLDDARGARDEAVTMREAVEKLRHDDLARAERLETERDDHLARALQAETERDEAVAALGQVRSDMEGVVGRQMELEAERDELAKQLEEATAPSPASPPAAAKKPAAKK